MAVKTFISLPLGAKCHARLLQTALNGARGAPRIMEMDDKRRFCGRDLFL